MPKANIVHTSQLSFEGFTDFDENILCIKISKKGRPDAYADVKTRGSLTYVMQNEDGSHFMNEAGDPLPDKVIDTQAIVDFVVDEVLPTL